MNFPYSQGEEVTVNTKSLKMTAGGRGPVRVYLCSASEKKKKKSLAKTEQGKGFYLCHFVHQDFSDTMKYQKLHATRLKWGVGWGCRGGC